MTRRLQIAAGTLIAWALFSRVLPSGVPLGIVVLGITLGGLNALGAVGLVLVHRSSRIVNFAQAEIGGLSAAIAVVMVAGFDLPYLLAVPVGLAVAVAVGYAVDATVVRRFFDAPRLILTVATIGVAQILAAVSIFFPTWFGRMEAFSTFKTPFQVEVGVGPVLFNGDHFVALAVAIVCSAALAWFFQRSDTGVAIRAAADSNERALLLGIPVRRLSRVTWMLAAGLSGLSAILSAPILGANVGVAAGPQALLAPLAAAVLARMERLSVAVAAALGIGVFQQVLFWNYPRASYVDVGLFVIILGALLLGRKRYRRVSDSGLGGFVAATEVRPVPASLRALPAYRLARLAGIAALVIVVALLPPFLNSARVTLFSYIVIFAMIAVSLVVLTGWAGQISLGHFAFVGVGSGTTAALLVHAHADLFVALLVAALIGAGAAVVVGIPALRLPGLYLAVTTLAFGVPVSTYLLNSTYFPRLNPVLFERPVLLSRFSLATPLPFYYLCLALLVVTVVLARNFRATRAGRVVLAVRDNERAAAAYAVEPLRAKLSAFAFSGAIAGVAGGLYVTGLRGVPYSGFSPVESLTVFTMVVIGGVASLPGAILGAVYVQGAKWFLPGAGPLLATGTGLLFLLLVAPGGLGELLFRLRDRGLAVLARRYGIDEPAFDTESASAGTDPLANAVVEILADDHVHVHDAPLTTAMTHAQSLVQLQSVDAAYGHVQVLFGVNLDVPDGEILALLGTNGAGKSTALRVLAGLMEPTDGRVIFEGQDITHLDPVERVKLGIVTAPGGRGVFPSLTVTEHLRLAGWLYRDDEAFLRQTTERALELFPSLRDRLDTEAGMLSGGEQQMLLIAQTLFAKPRLLLIDELSLGLAPTIVASLLDVVRSICEQGTTVVIVEQSFNVATSIAANAAFMERGELRFTGAIADLADRPDLLRSIFLRSAVPDHAPERPSIAAEVEEGAPRLEVAGLARSFGGVTAVNQVDLIVRPGEIVGIIGSNGAGKTTLFDMVSGFLPADSGRITFRGVETSTLSAARRARLGLGRSFQDARLFPSLTVRETLSMALERHVEVKDPLACMFRVGHVIESERQIAERADELVELMGLARYANAFVSELSTGTRRIVELGCALAHEPSVLLLDEPSSGIAQRESEALAEVLLDVKAQTDASLVVIEHDIPLVSSIADRMICLHLGAVIAEGLPADVLADPAVTASYLGTDEATIFRSGSAPAQVAQAETSTFDEWVTTAKYAELTGSSPDRVRALARAGELEAVKEGGRYLLQPPTNGSRVRAATHRV